MTSTGTAVGSTTSDADGDYDIAGIPVALNTRYDVRFSDPTGARQDQELDGILVLPGKAATVNSSLVAGDDTSVGPDGDWAWQYPARVGSDLSGVGAGDDDHIWAVGVHGTVLKSVDAGTSWPTGWPQRRPVAFALARVAQTGASRKVSDRPATSRPAATAR